jgi:hypothetical protein
MERNKEYANFEKTTNALLRVAHVEIRTKIEQEKAAKKRKKSNKSSASGREGA